MDPEFPAVLKTSSTAIISETSTAFLEMTSMEIKVSKSDVDYREQQVVFLVGATGRTGTSIARVLANQPEKFVKAIVRSSSLEKPIMKELTSLGVKLVTGDIVSDSQKTLESYLKDVNIVIITTVPTVEGQQDNLLRAAKVASIKRLVPSDFTTFAPPGSMQYQDMVSNLEL
ncbi:hypothetical protein AAF712_005410 [Marasmius tenuissimus]|uniref:NmrA-like domain-containing protein n=1 Tax=Marasmius tenuissimus TaxID=585030 RepID=A0ABR3A0F2_9AGAR